MPRHVSPPRLKDRCISSIALNMDLWCADFVVRGCLDRRIISERQLPPQQQQQQPFEFLTSDLVENILNALLDRKRLKLLHLELLLQTRLHQLDLSRCNKTIPVNDSFFVAGFASIWLDVELWSILNSSLNSTFLHLYKRACPIVRSLSRYQYR